MTEYSSPAWIDPLRWAMPNTSNRVGMVSSSGVHAEEIIGGEVEAGILVEI